MITDSIVLFHQDKPEKTYYISDMDKIKRTLESITYEYFEDFTLQKLVIDDESQDNYLSYLDISDDYIQIDDNERAHVIAAIDDYKEKPNEYSYLFIQSLPGKHPTAIICNGVDEIQDYLHATKRNIDDYLSQLLELKRNEFNN